MKWDKILVLLMAILLVAPLIRGENVESTSLENENTDSTTTSSNSISTTVTNTNITPTPADGVKHVEYDQYNNNSIDNRTYPDEIGDIIFEAWPILDHTALYVGDGKLVEADPHMDKWEGRERDLYHFIEGIYFSNKIINPDYELGPTFRKFIYQLQNRSYEGNTKYGNVEEEGFGEVYNATYYCYGKVVINNNTSALWDMRYEAVEYAKERASKEWPIITASGAVNISSRPFDYVSPWIKDDKQCDEYTVDMVMNNLSLTKTLDYGYGCSELVWAAWWHASKHTKPYIKIDLDSNITPYKYVWPWDIERSEHVILYHLASHHITPVYKTSQPVNLKLNYSGKIVYVNNANSLEEIDGEYYLKTSNNETYSMNNLTDVEMIQQNL